MKHEIDEEHLFRLIKSEMVLMMLIKSTTSEVFAEQVEEFYTWINGEGKDVAEDGLKALLDMQVEDKKIITLH